LAAKIGMEAARLLAGRFGRQRLNIPTPHRLSRTARNRSIRAEYDAHPNVLQLVRKYALSERSIRAILKEVD
jgi:Mor family transcriptional regulator